MNVDLTQGLLTLFPPAGAYPARSEPSSRTVTARRSGGIEMLLFGGRTFPSTLPARACSANSGSPDNNLPIDAAGTRATHRGTRTSYRDGRAAPAPARRGGTAALQPDSELDLHTTQNV